jgi:hypothetical protein
MKLSAATDIATHSDDTTTAKEKVLTVNNDVGCSWGMEDDHSDVVIDQEQSARVDAASLPSIDSFFSSQQYKISDPLYKLVNILQRCTNSNLYSWKLNEYCRRRTWV